MNQQFLCVVLTLITATYPSVCQDQSSYAKILVYENENAGLGRYNFKFDTSDGTKREENGDISNPESDNGVMRVQGSYSYTAPDGRIFTVHYIADDQGYRPQISESLGSINAPPFRTRVDSNVVSSLQGGGLG